MAAWCLPRNLSNAFLDAIRDGRLAPEALADMTSAERRAEFAKYVGDENAQEVNAQFESKLLLNDFKRGLVAWANKTAGLTEPARRDILASIEKLDKVLNPEEEKAFLADLAAKKLGVTVTADEARDIFRLSQAAEQARQAMVQDIDNEAGRIAYGRAYMDLIDHIEGLKPEGRSFSTTLIDVLNVPRTALTSILHFSAPFVQGWGMLSTKNAWVGFGRMFQYFAAEENYKNLNAWIISHPDYELARDGKLGLTKLGDKLSDREEAIQSTLVEKANEFLSEATGVPNLVRASSRAFTGYLNYVRFSRFADLMNAARLAGEDVRPGSRAVRDLAKVVNDFTGRGELGPGDQYKAASGVLNAIFFAPRKFLATVQMFNPVRYLDPRVSPTARRAAIRQLLGSVLATSAVLAIARAMGAEVNPDPRSSDFGRIIIGGEKLDITGSNDSYIRLLARLATGQEITAKGKEIDLGQGRFSPTRADIALNFMRGKLSPVASALADALYGKDPAGREFSLTAELREKLMPITMQEFLNFAMNDGDNTAAWLPAAASVFGVGLESPLPPLSRTGQDVWGQPMPWASEAMGGSPPGWRADPVNQEMQRLGYTPTFPMDTIRGVKLTKQQFHDYIETSGRLAHMHIESLVQSPGWEAIPAPTRLNVIKGAIRSSRDMAATQIMLQSQGSPSDIMARAVAAKMAVAGATVQ